MGSLVLAFALSLALFIEAMGIVTLEKRIRDAEKRINDLADEMLGNEKDWWK